MYKTADSDCQPIRQISARYRLSTDKANIGPIPIICQSLVSSNTRHQTLPRFQSPRVLERLACGAIKVRSHEATSRRDMLRGHVVRSESHEATKLGENKSHKRLYALGHTKRHFHATSRSVK